MRNVTVFRFDAMQKVFEARRQLQSGDEVAA